MVQFERECEQRVKLDAEEQLAHWKETELARIRAEEQMHFHEELEKMRESYEREHKVRREQAVALEQKLKEKLQRKLSDIESGNYQERQKLLQEYEAFRHKEAHMKKEMELNERTMQLERERVQREIEAAHARVMDADRAKDQLAVKLREEMDRYQMGMMQCLR